MIPIPSINDTFTNKNRQQIENRGLKVEEVQNQLSKFKKGFSKINIYSSATIGDGIIQLENIQENIDRYEIADISVQKFVPASGVSTRMFKLLFSFLNEYDETRSSFLKLKSEQKKIDLFFSNLHEFAFYDDLSVSFEATHGISLEKVLQKNEYGLVVESLLNSSGLNYGNLPKGLLKFHSYGNSARTPVEEHLIEGMNYATKGDVTKIHFTVSHEHLPDFEKHVEKVISQYVDGKFKISFSQQKEHTDTIALTLSHELFRNESGNLLFRPAGHGALLENLNQLDSDIIFVKNIDNVMPDRLKDETIRFKKAIAGVLLFFQRKIFSLLERYHSGENILNEANDLLNQIGSKGSFSEDQVLKLLNRPIRVCGMVKNKGEPGGGPFWIQNGKNANLQIIESTQIDKKNENKRDIFESGTHFNPVDLVLGVRNYKGEKFDLLAYRDEETGFILEKTYNGQKLLAIELPGLWNGGMANWNTLFVEVPSITFNPVKEVTDLLKESHR